MTPINSPFTLKGKRILITGASSGIGQAVARWSSREGADLLLNGRDPERLQLTLEMCTLPHRHVVLEADLNDDCDLGRMLDRAKRTNGTLDGIVHAAGISSILPVKMTSREKIEELLRINVVAGFSLVRDVLKRGLFCEDGASVVFLSSVMAMVGEKGRTLYSMSKGAVLSGVRSMASELAERKIRVNTLSPGVLDTPMSARSIYRKDEKALARVIAQHPLGLGQAEDVAWGCIYLLSDAARWVTGTNMVIDGGYSSVKS